MTDKTREAFEAIVGETDLDLYIDETEEYYSGRTLRAFGKYCEDIVAATSAADAKHLLVIEKLVAIVNQQAEDDGLWFVAEYASEGYLQKELRLLHAAIEELAKPLLAEKRGV